MGVRVVIVYSLLVCAGICLCAWVWVGGALRIVLADKILHPISTLTVIIIYFYVAGVGVNVERGH